MKAPDSAHLLSAFVGMMLGLFAGRLIIEYIQMDMDTVQLEDMK